MCRRRVMVTKRDLIVFEHGYFELTDYAIWMTAGEIAQLFGLPIMNTHDMGPT